MPEIKDHVALRCPQCDKQIEVQFPQMRELAQRLTELQYRIARVQSQRAFLELEVLYGRRGVQWHQA
jgi:hypothetical protein